MNRNDVFVAVKDTAVELLKVEPEQVTEAAAFGDDLDADSLDLTEMVMALEDRLGIEVPEDDLEGVTTIGDAVDLAWRRVDAGVPS